MTNSPYEVPNSPYEGLVKNAYLWILCGEDAFGKDIPIRTGFVTAGASVASVWLMDGKLDDREELIVESFNSLLLHFGDIYDEARARELFELGFNLIVAYELPGPSVPIH
ncbi:hypothetical protein [Paralcaligenes ureilyticus]|uniref:Uncharacterized protein n=1 Tax=Paralcaligenes ureilyticus TaxID=627131 RepID=A0A4R3M7Z4_9BURK|nr:hypothetical protein [Paralcaligenes ureilyticus]TCT09480.1 hypothetical protein EDC26_10398 [Paralcaligenes ureilyticus]